MNAREAYLAAVADGRRHLPKKENQTMQTKPPFAFYPGNDSEILMPFDVFRSLTADAMNLLIAARAQKWDFYRRDTREFFVAVYLPAAAAARLLEVCRPMLKGEAP